MESKTSRPSGIGCSILMMIICVLGIPLYRSIRNYGVVNGILYLFGLIAFAVALFYGLDRYYKWRANRLVRSMQPGETLVASGLVSESITDETPAILVRGTTNRYRLIIAGSRGAVSVQSVTPELTSHENPNDAKRYIEVNTIQGPMHFAPRNSFLVAEQPAYAQQILDAMLGEPTPAISKSQG